MPTTVYKYELNPNDPNIRMPQGAKILKLDAQLDITDGEEKVKLWVECNPSYPTEVRQFRIYPTGATFEPMEAGHYLVYIDTVLMYDAGLVFHIYERK